MTLYRLFLQRNNFLHNRHFWIIVLITSLLVLFYNAPYLQITNWFSLFQDIITAKGIYAFIISFLFLLPILYSSAVFKIRGTLITWIIFLISVLPRAIYESTSFEHILIVGLFSLVALLLGIIMALDYKPLIRVDEKLMQERTTRWHYLARKLKIREYERQYLARKLHDNIIQSLLVIVNRANAIENGRYGDINPEVKRNLEKLQTMLLLVIDDVRRLSQGLRPSILDNTGLLPVLKWHIERIMQEHNIKVILYVKGIEHRLPSDVEVIIYRIIQEILNNICQHSEATQAELTLDFAGNDFIVTAKDNGKGFELPVKLEDFVAQGKHGFERMHLQAKLLDGKIDVYSEINKGTTVSFKVRL